MPWNVARAVSGTYSVGRVSTPKSYSRSNIWNAVLCVWTCRPGAMVSRANPMTWPYLRTGAPSAISATATLWPRGTASATCRVPPPDSP